MKISLVAGPQKNIAFVFFLFENDAISRQPLFSFLEKPEQDYLRSAIKKPDLLLKENETRTLIMPESGRKIVMIGLGKTADASIKKAGIPHRIAVQAARAEKIERFACWAAPQKTPKETRDAHEVAASNAIMANFEFVKYKTPAKGGIVPVKEIEMVAARASQNGIAEGIRRGIVIGEETNACRELSNMPGGDMTPDILARHAIKEAAKAGIKAAVLDEKKMKTLGMGGILGVGRGSNAAPRFIILEYMKGPKNGKPTVLVGKGITFDTGGLNLKPSGHIYEMHMDMSGGAAVIHAIVAAARLKLKKNIIAIVPAAENMPSGSSYRPGDILRTMNGITIEVLDTDAEGRVIMADALEYSKRYDPALVIDAATLTGAAAVALGSQYTGLFTTDKKLEERFRDLGEAVNDPVWPLPLGAEYEKDIKGTFGDWANVGKPHTAGASTAAVFLWQFIKGYPWVHLDIAPRMTVGDGDYLAKGALGTPVRLLVRFLEEE